MNLPARFPVRTLGCLILLGQALLAHDPHDPIQTVAVSPNFAQDQTIFAATGLLSLKYGIFVLFKSTNGGVIWSAVQGMTNNLAINQILFSPNYANDQTVYVVGTGGLFQTTDQGTSWTQLSKSPLVNAAVSPTFATDKTLYVLTSQGTMFMSANRGQTFTGVTPPAGLTGGLSVIALSPNYDSDKTLILGTEKNGLYLSTNSGSKWQAVTAGQTLPKITSLAFSPTFANDNTIYASGFGAGVLVSSDGGKNWSLSNTGITDLNVTSMALSPAYQVDSTIWITTAAAGVFQSSNAGGSWIPQAKITRTLSNLTTIHYQIIAPVSSGPNALLYLGAYEGLWSSGNNAQSWLYIDVLPTRLMRHVNLSPNYANDQTVFANTYGGGNLWSTDGGNSFTVSNTGMTLSYTDASAISPNFANDKTAFSSDAQGLQRSANAGSTWVLLQGLGAGLDNYPRALALSPNFGQDSTLLLGFSPATTSQNSGVYFSSNGGNTWKDTSLFDVTGIVSIAISPGYSGDKTAFAASPTNGLYKSTDGGMTWGSPLNVGSKPPGLALVAVTPSYVTDQTVFAAGISGGIFKSSDGGGTWAELPGTSSLRALDMQVSPNYANDGSLYLGTLQKGLLKFTNGGAVAVSLNLPDTLVTAVGLSPNIAKDYTIFAAAYHGLFKSTNSGASWTLSSSPARMEESRQANSTYAPQNPPSIIYSGTWTGINPQPNSSTNAYIGTTQTGATATLNFTGDGVRWVTSTGPHEGSATITLDGVPQGGPIKLTTPTTNYQQTLWSIQGLPCGLHSLTITAQTTPGQTVPIDAFDVWVSSCPLP